MCDYDDYKAERRDPLWTVMIVGRGTERVSAPTPGDALRFVLAKLDGGTVETRSLMALVVREPLPPPTVFEWRPRRER